MRKIVVLIFILYLQSIFAKNDRKIGVGYSWGILSGRGVSLSIKDDVNSYKLTAGFSGDFNKKISFKSRVDRNELDDKRSDKNYISKFKQDMALELGFIYSREIPFLKLLDLRPDDRYNTYVFAGISSYIEFGEGERQFYYYRNYRYYAEGEPVSLYKNQSSTRIGCGLGITYLNLVYNIHLTIEIPIVYRIKKDFSLENDLSFELEEVAFARFLQIGLLYYF
jgi:hypothetical protein